MAQLGVSLALTMHPTVASEFDCLSESSWLITTYALAMAASQPLVSAQPICASGLTRVEQVGKLSDVFARKPVLLFSYTMFSLGW